jgi:hypothetical protein
MDVMPSRNQGTDLACKQNCIRRRSALAVSQRSWTSSNWDIRLAILISGYLDTSPGIEIDDWPYKFHAIDEIRKIAVVTLRSGYSTPPISQFRVLAG